MQSPRIRGCKGTTKSDPIGNVYRSRSIRTARKLLAILGHSPVMASPSFQLVVASASYPSFSSDWQMGREFAVAGLHVVIIVGNDSNGEGRDCLHTHCHACSTYQDTPTGYAMGLNQSLTPFPAHNPYCNVL